jgi:hypothetical protein
MGEGEGEEAGEAMGEEMDEEICEAPCAVPRARSEVGCRSFGSIGAPCEDTRRIALATAEFGERRGVGRRPLWRAADRGLWMNGRERKVVNERP